MDKSGADADLQSVLSQELRVLFIYPLRQDQSHYESNWRMQDELEITVMDGWTKHPPTGGSSTCTSWACTYDLVESDLGT
jgi:hypothetical protein